MIPLYHLQGIFYLNKVFVKIISDKSSFLLNMDAALRKRKIYWRKIEYNGGN